MIIGIDGNEANVPVKVGIGEYSFELLKQFEASRIPDVSFLIYLKHAPLPHMPKERIGWKYKVIGPKKMWTQFALPFSLFTHKDVTVFFSPTHYAPRFSPVPTAISVMDLSYMYFPSLFKKNDLYQLQHWTAYSVRNATKVFTISQASKNDIIKLYNVLSEKVVVTYPGVKEHMEGVTKKSVKEKTDKYILFVGTLQPRKNITRLIEAFSFVHEKNPDLKLIIVGKKGWQYEEILEAPEKWNVAKSVIFKDFVDEATLSSLYRNALCLVFPSLYEGFGLPILEAMQYNCPVITSNVSSLPEVGGDAALYVDPKDPYDIAAKIEQLISDASFRKSLIVRGKEQLKKFSWEKAAKETLDVLIEMGKNER